MTHPVALSACDTYDIPAITACLRTQFEAIGLTGEDFAGKRVVLKPNLLLGYAPERCATTHPAVVMAAAHLAQEWGAKAVILAESPGGPYRPEVMKGIYRACGMTAGAEAGAYVLNEDLSAGDLHFPKGMASKMFHVLSPILQADLILNLCKLKTHALAQMTCGVKNLFGVIPGIEKFEMHARFRELTPFFTMLTDLCLAVQSICPVITVVDAIDAMEGNGPSGGTPRHVGMLGTSADPFALDLACAKVIGMEGRVPLLAHAAARGLCPTTAQALSYPLSTPEAFEIADFVPAQTNMKSKFDLIPKFMQPRPLIDRKKCIGCGKCIASCPAKAMEKKKGVAFIRKKECIKCYCCQELCTIEAVKIYKHPILRLLQPERKKK